MEEKERYKYYEEINQIYDEENDELYAYLNTNKVISILNQQDKRIKELEKVKEKFGYRHNKQPDVSSGYLCEFIDNQIKELKGK